jgi:FMN phosphatase YigB (HAD superfamily)
MKVSIDCWGTLINASPTFKQKKVELVKKYFPSLIDCDEHILMCFSSTKKVFNDIIENTGGCQPNIYCVFNYLFSKLNRGYDNFNFITKFIRDYQNLTMIDGPLLYSEETFLYLEKLSQMADLLISSNTMFIDGDSLLDCLSRLGVSKFFKNYAFSDQIGIAKPHAGMYGNSDYHIGDNTLTDGFGAKSAGSTPFIINSNDKTIKDAYNFIIQK